MDIPAEHAGADEGELDGFLSHRPSSKLQMTPMQGRSVV
jgi:hypothetical protein